MSEQLTINMSAAQWREAYKPLVAAWEQLEEKLLNDEEHDAARRSALDDVCEAILDVIEPLDDHANSAAEPADDVFLDVTLPRETWQPAFEIVSEAWYADLDASEDGHGTNDELNGAQDAMLQVLDPEE